MLTRTIAALFAGCVLTIPAYADAFTELTLERRPLSLHQLRFARHLPQMFPAAFFTLYC
jgi:hypothetical protein